LFQKLDCGDRLKGRIRRIALWCGKLDKIQAEMKEK
jgi:hypothetical protein